MKRISQKQVLSAVFEKVFGREFNAESLDDRVMLQKAVFLMREFGVSCGKYDFVWDHYGPFSAELSDDMKREATDETRVEFSTKAEDVMQKLKETFEYQSEYSVRYWVEAVASLHYLKKYMYPSRDEQEIVEKLEIAKGATLGNRKENLEAMKCLKKLFAA